MRAVRMLIGAVAVTLMMSPVQAATYDLSIDGTDAIFLAGRTDVAVPPLGEPFILARHGYVLTDFQQETHPDSIPVVGGDVVYVADPAVGGVHFFNGSGTPFGPEGNGQDGSNLGSLGGISGYKGPQGALTGVFLDDTVPVSDAPDTLDFRSFGLGRNFETLSPELGQVFYIGDGVTDDGEFQEFIAPDGTTRLYLAIPDGFSFVGAPGAYEDNDGAYRIVIGVNELPDVPVPSAAVCGTVLLCAYGMKRRRS